MPQRLKGKHDHGPLQFPQGFLWGSATSSYQVEGGNILSDWENFKSAGKACDHYHLYKQDFDLAKSLNHNAHRLSIEWSRIEPQEGQFDEAEIEHYVKVLKKLKSLNMTVMVTLWHVTLPRWVADQGGWENGRTASLFERYLKKLIPQIGEYVDLWVTVNEPGVYIYETYIERVWPHAKKSLLAQVKTFFNLASAHKKAYKLIHQLYPAGKPVGIANNIMSFEAYHKHSILEQITVSLNDFFVNHLFYFLTKGTHDFLGVNYYFHVRFKHRGLIPTAEDRLVSTHDISDLGWEVYPEGIFDVLTDLSDDIPIYITECGIASTNDDRRNRFLITYLQEVSRAIRSGVNVRGFFYWSLLDNFEWHLGFDPRFGLVEVDYETFKRTPRASSRVYADIIKHNGIEHKLLKLLGHGINVEEELKEILQKEH